MPGPWTPRSTGTVRYHTQNQAIGSNHATASRVVRSRIHRKIEGKRHPSFVDRSTNKQFVDGVFAAAAEPKYILDWDMVGVADRQL